MEKSDIWGDVLSSDPLFQRNEDLDNYIDTEKVAEFIANSQKPQGYFLVKSPMFYNTYLCVGILHFCGEKISKETIEYVKALETGSMGFSEMPGELPWTDRTYYGLKMMDWLGIEPKMKEGMIKFHKNLQNDDGGFGSIGNEYSNSGDTFNAVKILNFLDSSPRNKVKLVNWIHKNVDFGNLYNIYRYLDCDLGVSPLMEDKIKDIILQNVGNIENDVNENWNYEPLFYLLWSLKNLGKDVTKYEKRIRLPQTITSINIKELYFLVRIMDLFKIDKDLKEKVIRFVKKFEVDTGGFFFPDEVHIYKNNAAVQSLYMMGKDDLIDKDKYFCWLDRSKGNIGWGPLPKTSSEMLHYTKSSLISLKLYNKKIDHNLKERLKKYVRERLENLIPNQPAMHILRTICDSLEMLALLDERIDDSNVIDLIKISKLKSMISNFHNEDGGFGEKGRSYIYATYLAIKSLYLIEKYLEFNFPSENKIMSKIKDKVVSWFLKCQNEDGGLGSRPKELSNIQGTFFGLYCLWILKAKFKKQKKLRCPDKSFFQTDLLVLSYHIGSLVLI
ncbi:MAG: hypothetical protein GF368_04180 [Candidatus Aenigmarchaeota archaeon]|nr:hypothetical protein [Candidatus Aenigmarchaeota archaeon]